MVMMPEKRPLIRKTQQNKKTAAYWKLRSFARQGGNCKIRSRSAADLCRKERKK
jgi:hypothetical protein